MQPAAGDAGGALGAALSAWYMHHNQEQKVSPGKDNMKVRIWVLSFQTPN